MIIPFNNILCVQTSTCLFWCFLKSQILKLDYQFDHLHSLLMWLVWSTEHLNQLNKNGKLGQKQVVTDRICHYLLVYKVILCLWLWLWLRLRYSKILDLPKKIVKLSNLAPKLLLKKDDYSEKNLKIQYVSYMYNFSYFVNTLCSFKFKNYWSFDLHFSVLPHLPNQFDNT